MRKEFEINGCIEVQAEITEDEFFDAFIQFVESKFRMVTIFCRTGPRRNLF